MGVTLVVIGGVAWIALGAMRARSELTQARTDVKSVQDALLAGDTASANSALSRVVHETHAAKASTGGPAWWVGAHLPVAGSSLTTVRDLTAALKSLADGPLTQVVDVSGSIAPNQVLHDGVVKVDELTRASGPVASADAETSRLLRQVQASPSGGLVGPVAKARSELLSRLDDLSKQLGDIDEAAKIAPGMLGSGGTRTYLLAFQNNAEIKATGGIIGVYGILQADHGQVHLTHVGSDQEFVSSPVPVVNLGPEFNHDYPNFFATEFWLNANVSPNFPYAARIWQGLYERQSGTRIDGVIGLDPVALSDVLRATGPVRLASGESVTAANVVHLVEVDAYNRYNETTQRNQRKDFLSAITKGVFNAALHDKGSSRTLLHQLGVAGSTRHLQAWSARPAEQATIVSHNYAGAVYQGPAPYAAAVLDNVNGAKVDYYVARKLSYHLGTCNGATRTGTISLTLTNNVPAGLPTYVTDRIDAPRGTYPVGQNRLFLSVYLTEGAKSPRVTMNGKPVATARSMELGHPRLSFWIYLTPGQPLTLTVDTIEPATALRPVVPVQPMAIAQANQVTWAACPKSS